MAGTLRLEESLATGTPWALSFSCFVWLPSPERMALSSSPLSSFTILLLDWVLLDLGFLDKFYPILIQLTGLCFMHSLGILRAPDYFQSGKLLHRFFSTSVFIVWQEQKSKKRDRNLSYRLMHEYWWRKSSLFSLGRISHPAQIKGSRPH